ncbi:MAG: CehA/McbA family metallohydrolase [Chloroflexota bacterium]
MEQHITGKLKLEDMHRHIPHEFMVPAGAQQISIQFDFEPKRPPDGGVPHEISLSLFDPEHGRGARHNNGDQSIKITAEGATPGYTEGALQPGTWTVFIDTHRIMPPGAISYTLDIDVSMEPTDFTSPQYQPGKTASRGAGWYKGDLHGHTLHSDAAWDVPEFVAYARSKGLDFVTLTDHNTVSPLAQHDSLASDDILTMGGIELTTFRGHALALGTREWVEWRVLDGTTMKDVARNVIDNGALYVIAHPTSEGYPYCSGCPWHYMDMMPGISPAVEVWNGGWSGGSYNDEAVRLYYKWLNHGHRLIATAGSDIHEPFRETDRPGYNVVYAEDLTETAILGGIRQGHLYLTSGPDLSFVAANQQGASAMMGDTLNGNRAEFTVNWRGCQQGFSLQLIGNGELIERVPAGDTGETQWEVDAAKPNSWYTVEIRDANGELHAITNPIFLESE